MIAHLCQCLLLASLAFLPQAAMASDAPQASGANTAPGSTSSESQAPSPEVNSEDQEQEETEAKEEGASESEEAPEEKGAQELPAEESDEASPDEPLDIGGDEPALRNEEETTDSTVSEGVTESTSEDESSDLSKMTQANQGDVVSDESSKVEEPTASDGDTVLIFDDEPSESKEGDILIIDDGEGTTVDPSSMFEPTGRFRGEYQSRGLWDTAHEGDAEDIFEWWQTLNLYLKYQFAEAWDVVSEIDTRYGVLGEAPQESTFWGLNVSYSKWLADVTLRQGYLRWRKDSWEVSFGSRVFVWGKNELFAAADFLNPINAQGDVIGLLSDPRLAKEPVWAVDASYQLDDHVVQLVVVPVFARSDVPIIGRDLALAPPGTDLESQIRTAASIHPSVEDQIGDGFAGTEVPEESLWNSSVAFRGSTNLGGWDFAATIGWIWDRNPTIYLDDDLRGLLASGVNLLGANAGGNLSPEATAQLAAVQQKAAIGQELFRATNARQWVAALEGEGVLGPIVIRWDLGWKDGELAYTQDLESYRLMLLSGTLGFEYSYGESFFGQLSVFSQLGLDAPGQPLLGWDDGELDPGEDGRTASIVGGGLVMRGSPEDSDWDWSTRTVLAIFPFSIANVVEVGYLGLESQRLALGTLLIHGERGGLGDQFNRLNLVYAMYSLAF